MNSPSLSTKRVHSDQEYSWGQDVIVIKIFTLIANNCNVPSMICCKENLLIKLRNKVSIIVHCQKILHTIVRESIEIPFMIYNTTSLSKIDCITSLKGRVHEEDPKKLIPTTSYGGLVSNDEIIKMLIVTVVRVVLADKNLWVQSLD